MNEERGRLVPPAHEAQDLLDMRFAGEGVPLERSRNVGKRQDEVIACLHSRGTDHGRSIIEQSEDAARPGCAHGAWNFGQWTNMDVSNQNPLPGSHATAAI